MVEPVERGLNILLLATAVVVFSVAQTCSAEIETKHGESETVQRLHGMEDDFVVQSSTEHRVRMRHQRGMCGVFGSQIKDRFKTASRALEKE